MTPNNQYHQVVVSVESLVVKKSFFSRNSSNDTENQPPNTGSILFQSNLQKGDKVQVLEDGINWVDGVIFTVKENCFVGGNQTPRSVVVECFDKESKQSYFPKTWSPKCVEVPHHLISQYIRKRDKKQDHFDKISIRESNMYRLLKFVLKTFHSRDYTIQ